MVEFFSSSLCTTRQKARHRLSDGISPHSYRLQVQFLPLFLAGWLSRELLAIISPMRSPLRTSTQNRLQKHNLQFESRSIFDKTLDR